MFVRIGKRVVNLDNVTEMYYQPHGGASGMRHCYVISFIGEPENYISVDEEIEPEAFQLVKSWVESRPALDPSM